MILMKRLMIAVLVLGAFSPRAAREYPQFNRFKDYISSQDYLGARLYFKKNYLKISSGDEWLMFRAEIMREAYHVGFDLVYGMDRHPFSGLGSGALDINESRNNADNLVIAGKFEEAFDIYQKIAIELKRIRRQINNEDQKQAIDFLRPYIFQSMARALYGARKFDDAFLVYRWIPQSFAKIREVQFEKMWAAFRGGRIDHALGSIASQSSAYFNQYLPPEAYLVQTYLYKRLCRVDDHEMVLTQMRGFLAKLKAGKFSLSEYAKSDVETLVMLRLVKSGETSGLEGVSAAERQAEKQRIAGVLAHAYESSKTKLISDLEKALAYVQLTVRSGSSGVLKPIEKLPDRQTLFGLGLEIWPADSREEWVDEIGAHRFVGESLCKSGS